MKTNPNRLISLSMLLALMFALIPITSVYAADVLSVTSPIVNNINNTITVTGTGFDNTAVVLLDGTPLSTTFQDAQTLTAIVPAGVSAGSYSITVSMSGGPANGFAILTVNAPTPVPPTSTPVPQPFSRPQFVVHSSKVVGTVQKGKEVRLNVITENLGQATAYSVQAVFTSTDLVPIKTGGVAIVGTVPFDDEVGINQNFYVNTEIIGVAILVVDLTINYYDDQSNAYSDKFTLSIPVNGGTVSSGVAYPTATPTGIKSSQLVITNYSASIDPLQPGEQFALNLTLENMGNLKAQRITMIVGGGSGGGSASGTPQPGGVSGGSGDFANFAPVGASNVQSLGDLAEGDKIQATQSLIVNVNTSPGAYPMRISFSYLNEQGEVINDEQVITLLVYSLPNVDVSFYRPPDGFFVGQPGALPIQVVNIGKRLAVLGNMKVSAQNGQVENGVSLIGSLEAGGYFTLDGFFTPEQSGPQSLEVTIDYIDDFNQPRTLTKTLDIEVTEGFTDPTLDPSLEGGGGGGFEPIVEEETTMHKIFRFLKGLFGLDSSWPVWQSGSGGGASEPQFEEPRPVLPSGKGG